MNEIYYKKINDINVDNHIKDFLINKSEISIKAWSFLKEILKNYNIDINEKSIIFNKYNKPYLKEKNIYFNISHSKNLVAIIISNKDCGIDIQYIDLLKDINKLASKILSNKELENIKIRKNKNLYFYKQWSKKEAYYKCLGTGIKLSSLNNNIIKNVKTKVITVDNEKYCLSYCLS